MAVVEMSIADWYQVPDNPRQRDTERRATFAAGRHLAEYHKTHDYVFAATIDSEVVCKLDGHTRAYLWDRGELAPPPSGKVQVIVIPVADMKEAKQIYEDLDSRMACKKPSDQVFGATRENRFKLRSRLLAKCSFLTQMRIAMSANFQGDPYELTKAWKKELLALDKLDLTNKYPVLVGAMLLTIRYDGVDQAGPFWVGVDQNAGTKLKGKGADGIEALHAHMEVRKAEGRTAGYDNVRDIAGIAWRAYAAWRGGKFVKRLTPMNLDEVLAIVHKHKRKKGASNGRPQPVRN